MRNVGHAMLSAVVSGGMYNEVPVSRMRGVVGLNRVDKVLAFDAVVKRCPTNLGPPTLREPTTIAIAAATIHVTRAARRTVGTR